METKTTKKTLAQAKQRRKAIAEGKSKAKTNLKKSLKTPPKATIRGSFPIRQAHSRIKLLDNKSKFFSLVRQSVSRQLKQLSFELNVMLQVVIVIIGVWLHHFLINILFDKEQPAVLATMIPGLEWIMIGMIIRKILSHSNQP